MSAAQDVEFLVLGLGAMGSATFYYLARSGKAPVGLEQFPVRPERRNSHGRSRAFRTLYADPLYTQLAAMSLPLWREPEALSGEPIFHLCDQLAFARRPHEEL